MLIMRIKHGDNLNEIDLIPSDLTQQSDKGAELLEAVSMGHGTNCVRAAFIIAPQAP